MMNLMNFQPLLMTGMITQNEYFKAVVSEEFDDNEDLLFKFLLHF